MNTISKVLNKIAFALILGVLICLSYIWGFVDSSKYVTAQEKIVERPTLIFVDKPVEKVVTVEKIKYIPVGFLDQPVCQVNKFNGEKKQNINFVSKPETYSTENSTSSIKYVEKIIYVPGTNTTQIIYVPTTEIIYIEVPENNNKIPCNRGNKSEGCDPGNSAGQGNFPFEKENYPKPVK